MALTIGLALVPLTQPATSWAQPGGNDQATVTEFSRDQVIFDTGAPLGTAIATVPVSGTTDASDGAAIEARAVSALTGGAVTSWQAIATGSNGVWAGALQDVPRHPDWLQIEVRVQGSTSIARTNNSFAAGHVIDLWGQSELHRAVLSNFNSQRTLPTISDPDALQISYFDGTGAGWGVAANFRHVHLSDASPVTGNLNELANMLAAERPGEKFHIVFHTLSGTGAMALTDDSNTSRQWSEDAALKSWALADGQHAGLAIQSWYNADAGVLGANYGTFWLRAISGLAPDGSPDVGLDHYFSELYDYSRTRWAIAGPHRFESNAFDTKIPAIRSSLDIAFQNSELSSRAMRVLEPLAYRNGDAAGGDEAHPNRNNPDGQARLMMFIGQAILQAMGLASFNAVPEFDNAALSGDRTFVRVWSSAGPIITTRSARDEMATLPAGRPQISGFRIDGAEATRVELISGEARVYYNQAGDPFPDGSVLTHASEGVGTEILPDDLTVNEVWKDYPLVDLGQEGVEGIPVRGLTPSSVLDVIPAASAPAGYDPSESIVPAGNPFRNGSDAVSGQGGWSNSNGTSGTFNGDGTVSIDANGGQIRGNVPISVLTQPVIGQTVDVIFYITSPDAAVGDVNVIVRQAGGGGNVVLYDQTITPSLGQLVAIQVSPSAARNRLELLFRRTSGSQNGVYVVRAPVLR